jgi:hypothetical protein
VRQGGSLSQQRGPREAVRLEKVGRDPGRLAADVGRVGEEQDGAYHQRGVHEVHARAAEDLLREHQPDHRGQRDLPERDRGRQDQRDQRACHKEALTHLVAPHHREDQLDADARGHGDRVNRQHVECAEQRAAQHAHRVVASAERLEQSILPVAERRRPGLDREARLEAGVEERHGEAGQ